jgi:pimeloyl-ACP methyl ester carboxylesterase
MSSVTSRRETSVKSQSEPRQHGCLFDVRRGLLIIIVVLVALVALGVGYQTIATAMDKHNYSPRGQLYTVNGHPMHMFCMGKGSPAVILQAGLSADSLWWYRIQTQLSQHTQVCAYDRPRRGWSEAASGPRNAHAIVGELHALLAQAGISAPYVMAGHSYGAIWTRIYATQYPQWVAGIVLVDSGLVIPQQFANQSEFDQWKRSSDALQVLVWGIYRTGLMRLTSPGDFQRSGYPPEIVPELVPLHSANQVFDTSYAESVPAMWALTEASLAAKDLDNLPMAVLWASETYTTMERISALRELRDEIATFSSNKVTRIVEGANHGSILGNEQYAQQVSAAILDVIEAAKAGKPLSQ